MDIFCYNKGLSKLIGVENLIGDRLQIIGVFFLIDPIEAGYG